MNQIKSPLLSRDEAASYLGLSSATLAVWASTKRYDLAYIKVGRKVYYTQQDLDEFIERSKVVPNECRIQ
ncbi:hypothetical protein ST37_10825 [Vibrio sp. qd031]|uniref:helix-turn-helix domain-containing protein n=1 Tax=Vibrio sp. qd031 TaxID=1603038 RepID=UPI000A10FF22|nr:helix-turn-helix domain-containing protein [Vibrio sp. qd031]ORT50357.1 hypothetical protein ST37_10825 [Vibrio sp. qd031]